MSQIFSVDEISRHNNLRDLWIVVDEQVYDMTEFAPQHPGGLAIILKHAGRDATTVYSEVHSPTLISKSLPESKYLGKVNPESITDQWLKPPPKVSKKEQPQAKPSLDTFINTHDFELAAQQTLTPKTWAFFSSAATDLHTKSRNASAYADIGLRPRILVDVKNINIGTKMLGQRMDFPVFCAPAAMAKMVHPEGEKELARGCKSAGVPQCVSTSASFSIQEIVAASKELGTYGVNGGEMPLFFQLYVDKQREKSEKLLKQVEALGVKGIFVTVDAPVAGKREADERVKADESMSVPMSGQQAKNDTKGGSLGRIMAGFIDPTLSWSDIPWLRSQTKLPIVLKGVQTAMDAKKAADLGIDGIVLSNHGGRSLDTSPSPILLLLELQKCYPEVFDKMEVFVDGGITRGTDVFKALCLGARSVGLGRGLLYALNYGQEGVEKYISILRDEFETTMRMMGVTDITQLHPGLLNTGAVDHLIPDGDEHPYAKWRPRARI